MIGPNETERASMKTKTAVTSLRLLAFLVLAAILALAPLPAAEVTEFKDGDTVVKYVVEAPAGIAPAGTTDPAKQTGLFLCMHEHDRPTGDELMPVREALRRLGLSDQFVLLAISPQTRKYGADDHEPISKMIAWAKKTYPINPRRIYSYGKGEGSKISNEFVGLHPDLVSAAIGYSWGFWKMPVELKEPLKHAPQTYMVLGLQDLAHHLTNMRDAYERVSAKGYHVIYREFDGLSARSYHPPTNDDAIAWASRVRNRNLPLSPEESKLLKVLRQRRCARSERRRLLFRAVAGGWLRSRRRGAKAARLQGRRCTRGRSRDTQPRHVRRTDDGRVGLETSRPVGEGPASYDSCARHARQLALCGCAGSAGSIDGRSFSVSRGPHQCRRRYWLRGALPGERLPSGPGDVCSADRVTGREGIGVARNMANAILLPIRDSVYKRRRAIPTAEPRAAPGSSGLSRSPRRPRHSCGLQSLRAGQERRRSRQLVL